MQRRIIFILAVLIILLAAALAFVLLRDSSRSVPISIDAADENAVEPYHQEMNCIDRLLQDHNMSANEVGPALSRCQSHASGGQSQGQ